MKGKIKMQKEPENIAPFYDSLNLLIEKKPKGRFLMRSFIVQNYNELLQEYDMLLEKMKWLLIRRGRAYSNEIEGYCGQVIGKFKQLAARELSQVCGIGGNAIQSSIENGGRHSFSNEILKILPHLSNTESVYMQCYNCLFGNGEIDFTN